MVLPNTMATAAKRADPAVIPIIPGVARGFLNIPCNDVPVTARPAPIMIAKIVRGIRTSKNI